MKKLRLKRMSILFQFCILFLLTLESGLAREGSLSLHKGFADIVDPLLPAVVHITTFLFPYSLSSETFYKMYKRQKKASLPKCEKRDPCVFAHGSGFLIDSVGYIVTSYHTLESAQNVRVRLQDGRIYRPKFIAFHRECDIALLKIGKKGERFPYLRWGDSSRMRIGDWALILGSPYSLQSSLSLGVISSIRRQLGISGIEDGGGEEYIQTDAAVNVGNSGGPLLSSEGRIVGLITSIISPQGTHIGLGFALPSNRVREIINVLKIKKTVPSLGIICSERWGRKGKVHVEIYSVESKGYGAKSGLRKGDIMTHFSEKPITSLDDLEFLWNQSWYLTRHQQEKQKIKIRILRPQKKGRMAKQSLILDLKYSK